MNRQPRWACRSDAGFSFVELLVTIVIAGVIFAAMVPVFVGANAKNSADTLRISAANVAQDKIEKVRQLPYASIAADAGDPSSTPNLYNTSFADGQFGPSTQLSNGNTTRTIYTDYEVEVYPAASSGLASQYKIVTVTAYWTGNPQPVKSVTLQTIVYRQYAGPPLDAFRTDPAIDDNGVLGDDDLASVTLIAHVDLESGVSLDSVQFEVAAYGGQTVASKLVRTTDLIQADGFWYDGNGTFSWVWDCSTAENTVYDLQATAISTDGFQGNTMHLYPRIEHTVLPAPPSNVVATGGNQKVGLAWTRSSASNLASYEIYRSESSSGPWDDTTLIATIPVVPPATEPVTTYLDDPPEPELLVNGTTYFYAVRAVTSDEQTSAFAFSNPATPDAVADIVPPGAPAPITATAATGVDTVTLMWGAAVDPLPSSGIKEYQIERSADGATGWMQIGTWTNLIDLTYSDANAGWQKTWYYRIRAVDEALNAGEWSAVVSATTIAEPFHDLRISVKSGNNACYVWVLYQGSGPANGHYYDAAGNDVGTNPPLGVWIPKNASTTFAHLPDGPYLVYSGTQQNNPGSRSFGATVQAPFGTCTGVQP